MEKDRQYLSLKWTFGFCLLPLVWLISWTGVFGHVQLLVIYLIIVGTISAYTDLTRHEIPNWITYPAAAWGLAMNAIDSVFETEAVTNDQLESMGTIGLLPFVLGFLSLFTAMFFLYLVMGVGGGDVKLCAVIGGIMGIKLGFLVLLYAYCLAAIASIVIVVAKIGFPRLLNTIYFALSDLLFWKRRGKLSDEWKAMLDIPVPLGAYFALAIPLGYFWG